MRTRRRLRRNPSLFWTVVLPRVLGALIPVLMYLESNGFQVDAAGLQARAFSGAIGLLLLRTRTGRRLAFAGWLFMIAVIVLSFASIEHAAESRELLLWWLAIGGLWFVDWRRVTRWINRQRPTAQSSARHGSITPGTWVGRRSADV